MEPELPETPGPVAPGDGRPLPWTGTERSYSFPPEVIGQVHEMAEVGRYEIRGWGAKRRMPTFDDLVFLTASVSRYPLEGYRERCDTTTVLGTRRATRPLELAIPITIAGMSFGALSAHAKEALGRAATAVGTSTTTGDGGMTPEERRASRLLVYQCLPSRYGFNLADLRAADAIEVVIGQGAKPGGGGMLLGQKVSERVAAMRTLPPGIDQRSASRHPDWTGPDDLRIKIEELREATGWEKPVYVKLGATRVEHDVKLAVAAGADVVVVDGMQGGTGATQTVFIEHAGIPTGPARTTCGSRSRSCAKPPAGRSRSTSSSARPGSITTSSWPSPRAPTWWSSTVCRAGPGRRRPPSSSTPGSRPCPPCASPPRRCGRSASRTRSSSWSPAASGPAPTSRRRWRSAPTRSRSACPR